MALFRDANGRQWSLTVTVEDLRAVKDALDIHLTKLVDTDPQMLFELAADPIRCVDVIWVLCRSQAERYGVDERQFGRSLSQESFDLAGKALVRAVFDFFPKGRSEPMLRLLDKTEQAMAMQLQKISSSIEEMSPEAMLTQAIDSTSTVSS